MPTRHSKNMLLRAAFYGEKCLRRRVFITSKGWENVVFRAKMAIYGIKTHDLCSFRFVIPTTSTRLPHLFLSQLLSATYWKTAPCMVLVTLQTWKIQDPRRLFLLFGFFAKSHYGVYCQKKNYIIYILYKIILKYKLTMAKIQKTKKPKNQCWMFITIILWQKR